MKPKPIKCNGPGELELRFIGGPWPYISVGVNEKAYPASFYGYVEDRDLRRLMKWCQRCLAKRRRGKAER